MVNGIFLLENLKLDELAAQRVYEFALVVEPLTLVGATGSTVAPIAIRERNPQALTNASTGDWICRTSRVAERS